MGLPYSNGADQFFVMMALLPFLSVCLDQAKIK